MESNLHYIFASNCVNIGKFVKFVIGTYSKCISVYLCLCMYRMFFFSTISSSCIVDGDCE